MECEEQSLTGWFEEIQGSSAEELFMIWLITLFIMTILGSCEKHQFPGHTANVSDPIDWLIHLSNKLQEILIQVNKFTKLLSMLKKQKPKKNLLSLLI